MPARPIAISARGVSKSYWLRHGHKSSTLAEAIVRRVRNPFERAESEQFWALRDISFEVEQGEVVGLIGRNGAGKSTLLKVLSRITEMTTGEVDLHGRVGSLLEVGTGFHQDLTGRENIFMNGAMLGMTRSEIRHEFDAIVAFAGVERFLDTPVKRYSSGMYVRLAFAVAAHLRSEILIVDEVLAVGDTEFQSKCLGKMRDISSDGRTVIFVSHNMHSISLLCSRGIVLDGGRVSFTGSPADAIVAYGNQFAGHLTSGANEPERRRGTGEYRFGLVQSATGSYRPNDPRRIAFEVVRARSTVGRFYPSAHIVDERGVEIAQMDGRFVGCWIDDAERIEGELVMDGPWLKPGRYHVDMYLCTESAVVDHYPQACVFEVNSVMPYAFSASASATQSGLVLADYAWHARAVSPVSVP